MGRKKHILPKNTKVEVLFEGAVVGKGRIVEHLLEQDDMYPNKKNLFYKVDIEPVGSRTVGRVLTGTLLSNKLLIR